MNKVLFNYISYKKGIQGKITQLAVVTVLTVFFSPNIKCQQTTMVQPLGVEGIQAKKFYSSTIDGDNVVWFLTEAGIVSFDGTKWTLHDKNRKVTAYMVDKGLVSNNILSIAIDKNNIIWLGTDNGVTCIKNGKFINYQ
jgi:ligand-binding sensor domain-containing protein